MGVSIRWSPASAQDHDVTPGARSAAAEILRLAGCVGLLDRQTIPLLKDAALDQDGAEKLDPQITEMCRKLIKAIEQHGAIIVELAY